MTTDSNATPDTTLCDCCSGVVAVEDSQICYCGIVVCDRCMDSEHYQCADEAAQP